MSNVTRKISGFNYRPSASLVLFLSIFLLLLLAVSSAWLAAQTKNYPAPEKSTGRLRPIRDDVGFGWNQDSLKILIDYLAANEKETFRSEGLVAAISPHDDYLYAGRLYYPLFNLIRAKEVVISCNSRSGPPLKLRL